jgi:hypothetical protein
MKPEEIKKALDAQPFVLFRIFFTDGRIVDIPHRDHLFIAQHTIEIGVEPNPTTGIPAETVHGSPLHVVRLEVLQPGS